MGLYRIFSIVAIILLSDIVYETLGNRWVKSEIKNGEMDNYNLIIFSARCTLHYLHHQEVLDPAECEHSKWIQIKIKLLN